MNLQEFPIQAIDFSDETFRITEDLASEPMRASLKEIGQVNPVVLLECGRARTVIVCGFRRLHALRELGRTEALARIEPADRTPLQAFSLALLDNLSHRVLGPLECARALFTLKHACGVSHDALVGVFLPLLGLKPHKNVLRCYLSLHHLAPNLRRFVREERLTLASAERLALMPAEVQGRFARIFQAMRLSASLQRKVLDLVEELGAMTEGGLLQVLDHPEIGSVLENPSFSVSERGEKIHELLYRRRYPRLSHAREQFQAKKNKLGLPGTVRLAPDSFFESPGVRVEFDASSAADFRIIAAALHEAARNAALDGLFQLD